MKDYIIVCTLIPFLMFFPIQFAINQVNHYKITKINEIVYSAAHAARLQGYFTEEIIQKMKNEITSFSDINDDEIILDVTQVPKYRTSTFDRQELISYEVTVPIKRLIAYDSVIDDKENNMDYTITGKVHSEVLKP